MRQQQQQLQIRHVLPQQLLQQQHGIEMSFSAAACMAFVVSDSSSREHGRRLPRHLQRPQLMPSEIGLAAPQYESTT
jgi:hypothetical protein